MISGCFEHEQRKFYKRQRKTLKVGFLLHVCCCQINCCISDKSICDFFLLLLAYENRRLCIQLRRSLLMNLFCFQDRRFLVNRWTFFSLIKRRSRQKEAFFDWIFCILSKLSFSFLSIFTEGDSEVTSDFVYFKKQVKEFW